MDQIKFVEGSLQKSLSDLVCLSRPYHFKVFKGCLPHIVLGPFLNTLTQLGMAGREGTASTKNGPNTTIPPYPQPNMKKPLSSPLYEPKFSRSPLIGVGWECLPCYGIP